LPFGKCNIGEFLLAISKSSFSQAAFKFNARAADADELSPPPQATSITVEAKYKTIDAKFFRGMRCLYRNVIRILT
jgi:hypothetical protein